MKKAHIIVGKDTTDHIQSFGRRLHENSIPYIFRSADIRRISSFLYFHRELQALGSDISFSVFFNSAGNWLFIVREEDEMLAKLLL